MAWYRAGAVSVTNNSTAVTGAGTAWVTSAAIGETFLGPDGQSYEIVAINSATSLTIAPAYKGSTASGQNYALMPTQGYLRDLAAAAAALVESYSSVKNNAGTGKFAAGTSANPSLRNAADENTGLNFKGADQLALVTAGVERLAINASGIPSGTAAAHMLNRANHTGVQAISTVTGLQAGLDARVTIGSSPELSEPKITYRDIHERVGASVVPYSVYRRDVPDLGVTTEVGRLTFGRGAGDDWGTQVSLGLLAVSHTPYGGQVVLATRGGSFTPSLQLIAGDATAGVAATVKLVGVYEATTASSSNVFVSADGTLTRSTSSLKYKDDVEDVDAALMQRVIDEVRPIWYRSTCTTDRVDYSWWGLGAEELGAIDPRFVHWAHPIKEAERIEFYEVDEPTGEVDEGGQPITQRVTKAERLVERVPDTDAPLQAEGVMYERLVVPLLWHAKQQQSRLDAMEQRLAALEGR